MVLQIGEIHAILNLREEKARENMEFYLAIGVIDTSMYYEGRLDEVRFVKELLRELA